MGGNALKTTFTRRFDREEYYALCNEVLNKLRSVATDAKVFVVIPSYSEKESFGDMDILYSTYYDIPFDVETVNSIFNPQETVRNTSVISFDYCEFQIDLIHSKQAQFDYGLAYFSHNDVGNLIGKLAHQMGLKHGHAGLILPLRDADNKFGEIVLTLNHDETLDFLGLDKNKFNSGFKNLEEIFGFISDSHLYNPDLYKLENLNTIAKVRDRKRETYKKFLAYGETWVGQRAPKIEDKTVYIPLILSTFLKQDEFVDILKELSLQQIAKTKFNGEIVSAISGYKGKELGAFIKYMREENQFHPIMMVYLNEKQIENRIRVFLRMFQEMPSEYT